jgi:hypothetical protein
MVRRRWRRRGSCGRFQGSPRGAVTLEAVLVLPVMLMLLLGILQLATLQHGRWLTEYAAYQAARAGVVWGAQTARMKEAAGLALLPTRARTDNSQTLSQAWAEYRDDGRLEIWVDLPGEVESEAGWEELDFDDVSSLTDLSRRSRMDEVGLRRATVLTVHLRYWFELRIPLINAVLFHAYRRVRASETSDELYPLPDSFRDGRYFVPLEATHQMRMQSALARKWLERSER